MTSGQPATPQGGYGGNAELGQEICRRHTSLKSKRTAWDGAWQTLADYIQPRKNQISHKDAGDPDFWKSSNLYDGTAVRANMILASGCMAWLTPAETPWFAYDPPFALQSIDRVKQWLGSCTEEIRYRLTNSNFYSEVHESYLDRGCFGTSSLFCESPGEKLLFEHWTVGSYCASEGPDKLVDTVFRELKLTARQARDYFGEDNLPDKVRECLTPENIAKKGDDHHDFIHAIYPRSEKDRGGATIGRLGMPIASVYVHQASKHVVRESGYAEMPAFVSRFLSWGDEVYGYSPGFAALADIKALQSQQMNLDVLSEIAAFPRVLVPATMEGSIDLRAGGVTYFTDGQEKPAEWGTNGRYDIGLQRVEMRKEEIKEAFHVELFQMFAGLDKQMTAREVAERSQEKLVLFSPTFARLTTELYSPLLKRIFAIAMRKGWLPQPPQEAIIPDGQGSGFLPFPEISYTSRLALAIKAIHNTSWNRTMDYLLPLAANDPSILDNFEMDRAARDIARNEGVPPDWIADQAEVEERRKARAEAMQQQQMAAMAMEAAKKVGPEMIPAA